MIKFQDPWPLRGILLDPARQTERFEYYAKLISDLARWGFNAILLHLADDEGIALRLDAPPLLPTPGALTPAQWRALASLAKEHRILLIPELECLGHTGYMTRLERYADWREPPAHGGTYWSLCPLHPGAQAMLEHLFETMAEIFPGPYIHIGMDEADIGGSDLTLAAAREKPLWQIFGEQILRVDGIVRRLGRKTMLWSDHLLKHPELRAMLPRDIVVCHWLYGQGHRADYQPTTQLLLAEGFTVVGAPAGCWSGTLFVPHRDNLANLTDFDRACRGLADDRMLGMFACFWAPYRHVPATVHPVMRFAADIFSGRSYDFTELLRSFVSDRFGLPRAEGEALAQALAALHLDRSRTLLEQKLLAAPRTRLAEPRPAIEALAALAAGASQAIRQTVGAVRSHHDEVEQWLFTAEFLADLAHARLRETAGPDLGRRWRDACLRLRDYAGSEAEEPAMGQVPRYWRDSDHPIELLDGPDGHRKVVDQER